MNGLANKLKESRRYQDEYSPMPHNGLTVSVFYGFHDSCATFADRRTVLLHLEAERVTRHKHVRLGVEGMEQLLLTGLTCIGSDVDAIETLLVARLNDPLQGRKRLVGGKVFEVIPTAHHQNHIGTVLPSLPRRALIVCADGGSEDGTTRLYLKSDNGQVQLLEDLDHTPLTGRFYGTLTQLAINDDFMRAYAHYPGKTMGLAAYGHDDMALRAWISENWGWFDAYYTNPHDVTPLRTALGISPDYSAPWKDCRRCDVARNGQQLWVEWFLDKLAPYSQNCRTVALTGGCALNVVLNSAIVDSGLFDNVVVGPASSDSGQSLGALLWHDRSLDLTGPFLGRGKASLDSCPSQLVDDLLSGRLVGWFEGRSEIGPRALGHRSILTLPFPCQQRDRLNKLKGREPYRPVAPMIRLHDLDRFFATRTPSPYMSFAPRARSTTQDLAPAIVHRDGTSRLQTITQNTHPALHAALDALDSVMGVPILCNSSFNFAGEPMVDTPDDARSSFERSGLDVLYINGERLAR
jgi:carbamoyltransferase